MDVWDEISAIVRRHLDTFYETEAMDTDFRFDLDGHQRRERPPWIMMGREALATEELGVWQRLDRGELSKADALAEIRALMATYYEQS